MTDIPHRRIDLPGGAAVLLPRTDGGGPPANGGGMQPNSFEAWVRLVRPTGWDSGWHQASSKSLQRLTDWWLLVATDADIKEAWALTVGGIWPPPRYDDVFFKGVEWLNQLERAK